MSSASTGGTEGSSPASSPASAASQAMAAPKFGTLVPNRIFVGGISASTSEAELAQLFSAYGNVKATKIILDRAGVSKGYGFVTFETEEEAKRLQQESECIILRERKLNIAPAIKKQPFNRSFDGGSPPAVATSPYYYTNGMGLPYQNGLTFYNAGAPTPGAPLAPPTDPAALYQAAGVFGPQAASAHQTFAPMMYPCPAPSLYMPQQYQYSPMPYESYYTGAAGQPQYLYSAANVTSNNNSGGTTTTNGNGGTGATSPPSTHHYYTTTGPPQAGPGSHHHHASLQSGPSTPQLDHLYYSFATGPHPPPHPHQPQQAPPPIPSQQHNPMGLGDPQLLLYTTDCQQPMNTDTQNSNHEETRPTSSHSQSDHQTGHQQHQIQSTVNETHTTNQTTSTAPLVSLMPLKYPRYPNYSHPHSHFHPHSLSLHPTGALTPTSQQLCQNEIDESNASSMHCRTILYHPVCIQNPYNSGASLLPTPTNIYESQKNPQNSSQKLPYTSARAQNGFTIFPTMHPTPFNKSQIAKGLSLRSNNPQYNRKPPINNSSIYGTRGFVNSPHKPPHTFINPRTHLDYANTRRNSEFPNRKYQNPNCKVTSDNNGSEAGNSGEKSTSPPPAPYSPMTRPLPNYSPTNVQVQFYNSQARYQGQGIIHQGHLQPRRYGSSMANQMTNSGRKQNDKFGAPSAQGFVLRSSKFKVNGMMQVNSKNGEDGDSQQTRMPLTPPGTPRNLQDNQISDSCHQMQAMTL